MTGKMTTLGDLFAQDEEDALARTRAEIAAEKAAWDALPQEEKDRITAERDAKWDEMNTPLSDDADEDEEDEFDNADGNYEDEDEE